MSVRRGFLAGSLILLGALSAPAYAETIALIGTGNVSATFGPRYASLGHKVIFGSRSPDRPEVQEMVRATGPNASAATPAAAAAAADYIMLNVPWNVAEEVVLGLGDLSGKIIIDPINPRILAADGFRDYPMHTSNAERLQNMVPQAFVVKAFNTISLDSMTNPDVFGYKVTIPIAGNDAAAKKKVADLISALGYTPVDVGPVRYAHVVEGLYLIRSNSRDLLGNHFEYRFDLHENAVRQEVR